MTTPMRHRRPRSKESRSCFVLSYSDTAGAEVVDVPDRVWTSVEGCTQASEQANEPGTAIRGRDAATRGLSPIVDSLPPEGASLHTRIDVPLCEEYGRGPLRGAG